MPLLSRHNSQVHIRSSNRGRSTLSTGVTSSSQISHQPAVSLVSTSGAWQVSAKLSTEYVLWCVVVFLFRHLLLG